jgi:hypothetical protein
MHVERGCMGVGRLKRPAARVNLRSRHVGCDWAGQGLVLHESCTISALFLAAGRFPFVTHRGSG